MIYLRAALFEPPEMGSLFARHDAPLMLFVHGPEPAVAYLSPPECAAGYILICPP